METVNHPKHYTECSIECIDAMYIAYGWVAVFDFCKCNAFKYLWRFKNKNGLEDLKKSRWYVNKAMSLVSNELDYGGVKDVLSLQTMIEKYEKEYADSMAFRGDKTDDKT